MGLFDSDSKPTGRQVGKGTNLNFNSYAGTDIQCFLFDVESAGEQLRQLNASSNVSDEHYEAARRKLANDSPIRTFGELQTLSVSIANTPGPVRRLGEREVVEYKMGARTVAGSMIFALLNRDVFTNYMKGKLAGSTVDSWRSPNYVDEIPEFNILVQGANEFGAFASGLLIGVKLSHFGTTFSVDDLFTESTYNYVARHWIPFTDDWKNTLYDKLTENIQLSPLSQSHINDNVTVKINGTLHQIDRYIYNWWSSLPPAAAERLAGQLPQIQKNLIKQRDEGHDEILGGHFG